jgi:hypothetical protein
MKLSYDNMETTSWSHTFLKAKYIIERLMQPADSRDVQTVCTAACGWWLVLASIKHDGIIRLCFWFAKAFLSKMQCAS